MGKDKSEKKEKKRKADEGDNAPPPTEDVDMVGAPSVRVLTTDASVHGPTQPQPRKKSKKDKEIVIPLEDLSPIAQPLAQKKLVKKLHKTIKKGEVRFMY